MLFDPNNHIVQLCAEGMLREGEGNTNAAAVLFNKAWNKATSPFEKFTAAHYVARHQNNVADKLKWDKTALNYALQIDDSAIKVSLPSLYLNIGKCHEDLNDFTNAKMNYERGLAYSETLPDIPYSKMIKGGLTAGLDRISEYLPAKNIH